MNVLLDECLPKRLLRDLPDHAVTTVPRQGWAGMKNGALLRRAEDTFDVFVTIDSGMIHQQTVRSLKMGVIVLHAPNSRYETIQPLVPRIRSAVNELKAGAIHHIETSSDAG